MLERIKSLLSEPVIQPFSDFYNSYIMRMQDDAIAKEMKYLQRNNVLDVATLEQLIDLSYNKHGGK